MATVRRVRHSSAFAQHRRPHAHAKSLRSPVCARAAQPRITAAVQFGRILAGTANRPHRRAHRAVALQCAPVLRSPGTRRLCNSGAYLRARPPARSRAPQTSRRWRSPDCGSLRGRPTASRATGHVLERLRPRAAHARARRPFEFVARGAQLFRDHLHCFASRALVQSFLHRAAARASTTPPQLPTGWRGPVTTA